MTKKARTILALGLVPPAKREVTTLVTRPRGSWKWQDAFAISTYQLTVGHMGEAIYKFVGRSAKFSEPQLKRYGIVWDQVGRPKV